MSRAPIPLAARPATAASAAARALQWLARAWPEAGDPVHAIEALALSHACRLVIGSDCGLADDIEEWIACAAPAPLWAEAHLSASLLAAAGALRRAGALAAAAASYLGALAELEGEGLLAGANGALAALALHAGARPRYAAPPRRLAAPIAPADPRALRAFLADIETASAFGTVAVAADPPAAILLEGAAMAALRAYDLPLAMRILRARLYLGDGGSFGLAAGLDFLRLVQCDDGSFGDFDSAIGQLGARGESAMGLKLPVTLQAIWTMAELEAPSFRLFRAAFAVPIPLVRQGAPDAVLRAD